MVPLKPLKPLWRPPPKKNRKTLIAPTTPIEPIIGEDKFLSLASRRSANNCDSRTADRLVSAPQELPAASAGYPLVRLERTLPPGRPPPNHRPRHHRITPMFVHSPTVGEQVCVRYENEPEASPWSRHLVQMN